MKRVFPVLLILLFFPVFSFSNETAADESALFDRVGVTRLDRDLDAMDFTVDSLSGKNRSLSDFKGKVVFLNFWATWCGPCKAEVKDIDTLYKTLKDEDFTVMALDIQENRKKVRKFMRRFDIDFPVYLDADGSIAGQYSVKGIPTTYIIDPDGKVIGYAVGPRPWGNSDSIQLMRSLMKK